MDGKITVHLDSCVYHKMVGRWAESKGKGQMLKGGIGHASDFMLCPMARI